MFPLADVRGCRLCCVLKFFLEFDKGFVFLFGFIEAVNKFFYSLIYCTKTIFKDGVKEAIRVAKLFNTECFYKIEFVAIIFSSNDILEF